MKTEKQRKARAALWVVAGIVLALAAALLGMQIAMSKNSAMSVVKNPSEAVASPSTQEQTESVDWAYWQEVNPNLVCWVSVPGTAIDYAVVQAPESDSTFYLDHDIYGNYNQHGCTYIDADCSGITGVSTVIFGHNMGGTDVTMFADFAQFSNAEYAASHRTILLQTPNGDVELRVSAADVIRGSDPLKVIDFDSVDDMRTWYSQRYAECAVQLSSSAEATQLFTFVTCSYSTYSNERTVVYAQPVNDANN